MKTVEIDSNHIYIQKDDKTVITVNTAGNLASYTDLKTAKQVSSNLLPQESDYKTYQNSRIYLEFREDHFSIICSDVGVVLKLYLGHDDPIRSGYTSDSISLSDNSGSKIKIAYTYEYMNFIHHFLPVYIRYALEQRVMDTIITTKISQLISERVDPVANTVEEYMDGFYNKIDSFSEMLQNFSTDLAEHFATIKEILTQQSTNYTNLSNILIENQTTIMTAIRTYISELSQTASSYLTNAATLSETIKNTSELVSSLTKVAETVVITTETIQEKIELVRAETDKLYQVTVQVLSSIKFSSEPAEATDMAKDISQILVNFRRLVSSTDDKRRL